MSEERDYLRLLNLLRSNRVSVMTNKMLEIFLYYQSSLDSASVERVNEEFWDAVYDCTSLTSVDLHVNDEFSQGIFLMLTAVPHIVKFTMRVTNDDWVTLIFQQLKHNQHIKSLILDFSKVMYDMWKVDQIISTILGGLRELHGITQFGITSPRGVIISQILDTLTRVDSITDVIITNPLYDHHHNNIMSLLNMIERKPTLTHLTVNTSGIPGSVNLAVVLRHQNPNVVALTSLELLDEALQDDNPDELTFFEYLRTSQDLTKLSIMGANIRNPGELDKMAAAAIQNPNITELRLGRMSRSQGIGWYGVAEHLKNNTTLRTLEMSDEFFFERNSAAILQSLKGHPTLGYLGISGNIFDSNQGILRVSTLEVLNTMPNLYYFTSGGFPTDAEQKLVLDFYRNTLFEPEVDITKVSGGIDMNSDAVEQEIYLLEINRLINMLDNTNDKINLKSLNSKRLADDLRHHMMSMSMIDKSSMAKYPLTVASRNYMPTELSKIMLRQYLLELKN